MQRHKYTWRGRSLTLKEWSAVTGIPYKALKNRITSLNWPLEKALTVAFRGIGGPAPKDFCIRGHPFSGDNLRITYKKSGRIQKVCLICRRERGRSNWRKWRYSAKGQAYINSAKAKVISKRATEMWRKSPKGQIYQAIRGYRFPMKYASPELREVLFLYRQLREAAKR